MLPSTYLNNSRRKLRPISAADTAATTGLTVNPNGTYVANSFPTTAAAGQQGAYGATLPQTNTSFWNQLFPAPAPMSPETLARQQAQQRNLNMITRPVQSTFNRLTGAAPWWGAMSNASGSPDDREVPDIIGSATYQQQGSGRSGREYDQPGSAMYQPNGSGRSGAEYLQTEANMNYVLQQLDAGDMSILSSVPQADLEAMGLTDVAKQYQNRNSSTRISSGNTDFQQTAAAQWNQANNVPLEQQLRWDYKKRKYISVGQWMKQEGMKFNKHGRYVGNNHRKGGGNNKPAAPANTDFNGNVDQIGVVNFNTATG